jgi:hypothetical protein
VVGLCTKEFLMEFYHVGGRPNEESFQDLSVTKLNSFTLNQNKASPLNTGTSALPRQWAPEARGPWILYWTLPCDLAGCPQQKCSFLSRSLPLLPQTQTVDSILSPKRNVETVYFLASETYFCLSFTISTYSCYFPLELLSWSTASALNLIPECWRCSLGSLTDMQVFCTLKIMASPVSPFLSRESKGWLGRDLGYLNAVRCI